MSKSSYRVFESALLAGLVTVLLAGAGFGQTVQFGKVTGTVTDPNDPDTLPGSSILDLSLQRESGLGGRFLF